MVTKLRVVKSAEEEAAIFDKKQKDSSDRLDYLIVQALCFSKYTEYFELIKLYQKNQLNPNPDRFLQEMNNFKGLFELGIPSDNDFQRVKGAFDMVKLESQFEPRTQNEAYLKNIVTRLMIRAIIDNKIKEFEELSKISKDIREDSSPDTEKYKAILAPYVIHFDLKVINK
jgi:hypothetical protein